MVSLIRIPFISVGDGFWSRSTDLAGIALSKQSASLHLVNQMEILINNAQARLDRYWLCHQKPEETTRSYISDISIYAQLGYHGDYYAYMLQKIEVAIGRYSKRKLMRSAMDVISVCNCERNKGHYDCRIGM